MIRKPQNSQTQLIQERFLLTITRSDIRSKVNTAIYLDNQLSLVTIKIGDKPPNSVLSTNLYTQLTSRDVVPKLQLGLRLASSQISSKMILPKWIVYDGHAYTTFPIPLSLSTLFLPLPIHPTLRNREHDNEV